MRLAGIDIGTNTILMLIAEVTSDGTLSILRDEHTIARLGKGVDEHGVILKETFIRVRDILKALLALSTSYKIDQIIACGTSALRDAVNRKEFIEFIDNELAIKIRVLSGEEEAKLTYKGAISEYLKSPSRSDFAVLDIGGGSTEFIVGNGTDVLLATSIDIGSVRITERILKTSPPSHIAIQQAEHFILNQLSHIAPISSNASLIGVAGTLTTLASLDLRLHQYDSKVIHGHVLTQQSIDNIFDMLKGLSFNEIISYPQIHPQRADIILAGILILQGVLKKLNMSKITVSDRGLRYGLILQAALSHN